MNRIINMCHSGYLIGDPRETTIGRLGARAHRLRILPQGVLLSGLWPSVWFVSLPRHQHITGGCPGSQNIEADFQYGYWREHLLPYVEKVTRWVPTTCLLSYFEVAGGLLSACFPSQKAASLLKCHPPRSGPSAMSQPSLWEEHCSAIWEPGLSRTQQHLLTEASCKPAPNWPSVSR